jgi:preprotein translocase subunit SecD
MRAIVGALVVAILAGPLQTSAPPTFELHLAEYQPAPGLRETTLDTGKKIYVGRTLVTKDDVVAAHVKPDGDHWSIVLQVGFIKGILVYLATMNHAGRPIAIMVDGELMSAPEANGPLFDTILITGSFTRDEADAIAQDLNKRPK